MIFNLQDTPQSNRYYLSEDGRFRFRTYNSFFIYHIYYEDLERYMYELHGNRVSFFDSSEFGAGFTIQYSGFTANSVSDIVSDIELECPNFFNLYNYPVQVSGSDDYRIDAIAPAPATFELNNNDSIYVHFFNAFVGNDFATNLYSELLDNSEQFQLAKSFLNDIDPSKELDPNFWTDTQLKFFDFVEKYNKNVISLRAAKKVNANVSGSISRSGESDIDLSSVVQQLSGINNKLQRVDENQETKNITQTINDLNLTNQTVITTVEKAPYNPLLDDDFEDF